jgi:hypothetical protein
MRTYSGDFMASRYGLVAVCGITRGARFLVSMRVRSGERNKVFQAYCVKLYIIVVVRCYLRKAETFDEIGSARVDGRAHARSTHARTFAPLLFCAASFFVT